MNGEFAKLNIHSLPLSSHLLEALDQQLQFVLFVLQTFSITFS